MTINITQGNTLTMNVSLKDKDGNPQDLTGWTLFFTVKRDFTNDKDDSNALIKKTISSFDSPTTGVQEIDITSSETNIYPGEYLYGVKYKTPLGVIKTPKQYPLPFVVKGDVTRRTV